MIIIIVAQSPTERAFRNKDEIRSHGAYKNSADYRQRLKDVRNQEYNDYLQRVLLPVIIILKYVEVIKLITYHMTNKLTNKRLFQLKNYFEYILRSKSHISIQN